MKPTQKQIAEIARATKKLHPEGLGNTLHFYLNGNEIHIYEDVSGQESYPGETGTFLLSAHYPLTRSAVEAEMELREQFSRCAV